MSSVSNIAAPITERSRPVLESPDPPTIDIDPRYAKAFPEQTEMLKRFNSDLQEWWRLVTVEGVVGKGA